MRKISEITGFSPATVSNALNYKKGVNAETSAKIFKVAQDLGYFEENHIRKIKFVMFKRMVLWLRILPFYPADFRGGTGMPRLWNGNADVQSG
ncbi:MAG: helix-turn-helix domain-containing protein [Blautia marasmi]